MLLTRENYNKGFLVDDEAIGGVTEMAEGNYAAYVSHYLTGETYAYQEFDELDVALDFLSKVKRKWVYEGVGCSKKTSAPKSGCGSGGCGTGGCGPTGCSS